MYILVCGLAGHGSHKSRDLRNIWKIFPSCLYTAMNINTRTSSFDVTHELSHNENRMLYIMVS